MTRATMMLGLVAGILVSVALGGEPAPQAHEFWVALRADGQPGTGTITDPFDAGSVQKLNALFEKFRNEFGDNLTIHFGPGVFYGDRRWDPKNNWKIRGAGMDVTIFKTKTDPDWIETVGFRVGVENISGFELSDCTFDFNTPNLRKANRAFFVPDANAAWATYCYAKDVPAWSPDKEYKHGDMVAHTGVEYIMINWDPTAARKGAVPAPGPAWSILRPNRAETLPAWKAGQPYACGDAVAKDGGAYLCLAANTTSDPAADKARWQKLNPDAPDPGIYTQAAFIPAHPPAGRHRISRVRASNGNGSAFFDREDFIFGVGGNDSVIEDCVVDQFHGDYASLIVLTPGQHGVIRGCSVRCNGKVTCYGGWGCFEAVFEDNFCSNGRTANNIDSLANRNVTFRNNVFMNCVDCGLLVNLDAIPHKFPDSRIEIDGKPVDLNQRGMDGLFIYNNLIELQDGAHYGAIQVQTHGLKNVAILNNTLRTTSGAGRCPAIGAWGNALNGTLSISGNICETNMFATVGADGVGSGNTDLQGRPMQGLERLKAPSLIGGLSTPVPSTFDFKAALAAVTPGPTEAGLRYEYYEGDWFALPDFDRLTAQDSGVVTNLDLSRAKLKDYFAVRFSGFIEAPKDGLYCFALDSDDGSKLFIGDKEVVDNDGCHGVAVREGSVALRAGKHPFRVVFFQRLGEAVLSLKWRIADEQESRPVTDAMLSCVSKGK